MSDWADDIFGGFPNRPDHPDFWKLSDIVLWMDGACEDPGGFERVMAEAGIDARSLVYMAQQRAMRTYRGNDPEILMHFVGLYIDAFITGINYAKKST